LIKTFIEWKRWVEQATRRDEMLDCGGGVCSYFLN
jgi:hypothetical protein